MIAHSEAEAAFRAQASQRILVKDGPYGTAIQALGLTEDDYRGKLTTNHDQKGNNDILNLTRPDAIAGVGRPIWMPAPICLQPTASTPTGSARPIMAPRALCARSTLQLQRSCAPR